MELPAFIFSVFIYRLLGLLNDMVTVSPIGKVLIGSSDPLRVILLERWFMPVNILLTFIIGSALGWLVMKITRTPEQLRGLVISCCSAVCDEQNSPFGDSSTSSTYAKAYASLSMAAYANNETSHSTSIKSPGETSVNFTQVLLPSSEVPILEKIKERVSTFVEKINIKKILAPSTIAAIVGLTIGIVSPIRKAIIGDSALRVIYTAGANLLKGN
ncbi:hypothetical protein Patl1_00023 [Pistacia atlantica]|uniref:Uncharacterized protein n=1 Tax=Pistacia atlantica TaxID=434234 RepID=A0ACC1C4I9_9ROSI|nr:hypothetical protein Patl1_00023 [Pistacia atlantica]